MSLAAIAPAQEIKTVFARKLHVVIPGSVASGGVSWAKNSLGLPRAWSAEAEGTRTEVAQDLATGDPAAQQARLKEILPGATLARVNVSGTASWQGTADGASIIGVPHKDGFWIVLSKGPQAQAVTASVCAERDQTPGFMPRTIPGGMSMVLPYNPSPRRDQPGWEMKFGDGIEFNVRIDRADPGKKLDIKKTMDDEVASYKNNKAYSDVKVDRQRMRDLASGEMAVIKFKEGGRAKERVSLMGINGSDGLQINWTFDPANPKHRDVSNRMALTFKKTNDALVHGERVDLGNGFSFETNVELAKTAKGSVDEWVGSNGGLVVIARHVTDSRNADPTGAAGFFPEAVRAQMGEQSGFKSQTVPYVVNGVDGLLVKTEWKGAWRYGLFLATFNGIYVLDVMGMNKAEVEHIIRSAQISIFKPADPFKQFKFEGSDMKIWTIEANLEHQIDRNAKPYKSLELYQNVSPGEGLFQSALHILGEDEKDCADLQGVSKNYAENFAKAMKGKLKMINQGWQSEAVGSSYWTVYEIEVGGNTFKCTMLAVASGRSLLLQTGMLLNNSSDVRGVAHLIMNSYRHP